MSRVQSVFMGALVKALFPRSLLIIYAVLAVILLVLTLTGLIRWTWGPPGGRHSPVTPGIEKVETI